MARSNKRNRKHFWVPIVAITEVAYFECLLCGETRGSNWNGEEAERSG